jgi:hypothetical protein
MIPFLFVFLLLLATLPQIDWHIEVIYNYCTRFVKFNLRLFWKKLIAAGLTVVVL